MATFKNAFDPVVDIDAGKFTEAERNILLKVVARDEEIRIQEKSKIENLKIDLNNLREKGVPDGEDEIYGRVCKRCRTPLGLIFNSGALCPNCSGKVCKSCRVTIDPPIAENSWLCTVCAKIRDIRAESGAWFYDSSSKKMKTKKAYGSFLIKSIFSKARKRDTIIYKDPDWTEIIEKDEPIPEEDDDRDVGYLMISPTETNNSFSIKTGNADVLFDKSVVNGDGSLIISTQKEGAHLPLNLLLMAHGSLKAENSILNYSSQTEITDKIFVDQLLVDKEVTSLNQQKLYSNIVYDLKDSSSDEDEKSHSVSDYEEENDEDEDKLLEKDLCELIEGPVVEIEDPGKTLKNAENEGAQLKVFLLSGEKESKTHLQEMLVIEKPAVLSQNIKSEDGGLNGITSQVVGSPRMFSDEDSIQFQNSFNEELIKRNFLNTKDEFVISKDSYTKEETCQNSYINRDSTEQNLNIPIEFSKETSIEQLLFVLNDLDLSKDLRKEKFKRSETDEHSSASESETEDYLNVISPQVIASCRKLSDVAFVQFQNNGNEDLVEKIFVNIEDEVVIGKDNHMKKEIVNQLSDERDLKEQFMNIKIDFSKMRKIGSSVEQPLVLHNDSDLRELQNILLRKKPLNKLKTDEHSGDSEGESETEDCSKVFIPKVVTSCRKLSDEDFIRFQNNVNEDLVEKIFVNIEDEVVIGKDNHMKKEIVNQLSNERDPKEQNIKMDFSKMRKIGSSVEKPLVLHNDLDLVELQNMLPTKKKFSKLKTDEHSGGSESESETEDFLNPFIQKVVNNIAPNLSENDKAVPDNENLEKKQHRNRAGSIESIGSNYSIDDDIQPAIGIAGEIKVGFKYNAKGKVFEVQVHQAKDLIVVDVKKNSTDPYVKVYLQPDVKRGGKRKTKPKKNSLNPEFDEILKFDNLEYADLMTRTCLISVWHYDFYTKNVLLGEVSINLQEYVNSGYSLEEPLPQWYNLCARKVTKAQVKFIGKIVVNIRFESSSSKSEQTSLLDLSKGSLYVKVKRAHNVLAVYEQGYSNPFCKGSLICPGSTYPKFKTSVAKNTVNPVWEDEFVFTEVSLSSLKNSTLQLSVWDYEKGSQHVILGAVRLGLGKLEGLKNDSFGEEVTVWQNMLDNPSSMEDYIIPLRSSLDSVKEDDSAPATHIKENSEKDLAITKRPSAISQRSLSKFLQPDSISLASSGSMLSVYSSQGGEQHNLVISGQILFSLKYDNLSGIFSVNIDKAKDIAAANSKQQCSDPYVKVYLLPDKSKSTKKKTTHKRKTLNPQWNEIIKYKLSKEELLEKILQLSIWNHDRFGRNDFLGEVQVNMQDYLKTNSLDVEKSIWYTLQEMTLVSVGSTNESKGQLRVALKYDNNVLTLVIKDAVGLPLVNPDKLISPFVRCYLLPDRTRKSKRKTTVQKKTQSPVWNEKFEFNQVSSDDLQSCVLEVTVWDHDSSSHQFLAGMRLGLSQGDEYWHDCIDKEVLIWESMMHHRGIFAEFTIPLRGTMTSKKGEVFIPMINQSISSSQLIETSNKQLVQEFETISSSDKQLGPGVPAVKVALQFVSPESLQIEEEKKGIKKKSTKGILKVHLKDGKNLPIKKDGDLPSSFCKVFMYPKKKNLKFKTKSFMKSVDPNWDTGMSFEGVTHHELADRCLEIAIFDESADKNSNKIGIIRLGSGEFKEKWDDSTGRETEIWNSMLNNPDKWVSLALPLRLQPSVQKSEAHIQDIKKTKKSKSETHKEKEELIEDDEKKDQNKHIETSGNESPRTAALRAMGVFANTIVDDIQKENEYNPPAEGLTSIAEENELELSLSPKRVPEITISTYVKPGDPPFPGAGEIHVEEYKTKEPKKQTPAMSLLKRSTSETSLASIYSTDSANIYGQIPIRGEIQFGMKYDDKDAKFEIHIFKAISLAAVDTKKETSDPYCKVYLLPDKTKKGKKKTKTKKKTLDPDWEEVLTFSISQRDLRARTLWVSVWHQERLGRNIFLGEVMLNLDLLVDRGELSSTLPKLYTLCEKGEAPVAHLTVGELKISLMFEDQGLLNEKEKKRHDEQEELFGSKKKKKKKGKKKSPGKINVHIKEACDLPAADRDGFSDPFCKCYLLPLKSSKTKRKTPVIKRTCNPVWDYQMTYELDYEDLADFGIEFTIWDWDRAKGNDFLGCARINLGGQMGNWDDAEGVEILAWQHLIDQPNKWKDFVIPLRSSKDVRKWDAYKGK